MINTHFANMEGKDLVRLSDDERQILVEAGLQFPQGPDGTMSNQLEVQWDTVRAKFDFKVDPSSGVITNDQAQYEALQTALQAITPQVNYYMSQDGYKFNLGEAYHSMFSKLNLENLNDIITKMSDEEKAEAQKQPFPIVDPPQIRLTGNIPNGAVAAALAQGGVNVDPQTGSMQEAVDLGDIYKDPTTGPSVKAQIQQMAGLQPEVTQAPEEAPVQQGPTPDELALKQRELDLKQQGVDQKTVEIGLKAHAQHHAQQMDLVREHNAPDPMEMAKLKSKPVAGATK